MEVNHTSCPAGPRVVEKPTWFAKPVLILDAVEKYKNSTQKHQQHANLYMYQAKQLFTEKEKWYKESTIFIWKINMKREVLFRHGNQKEQTSVAFFSHISFTMTISATYENQR